MDEHTSWHSTHRLPETFDLDQCIVHANCNAGSALNARQDIWPPPTAPLRSYQPSTRTRGLRESDPAHPRYPIFAEIERRAVA